MAKRTADRQKHQMQSSGRKKESYLTETKYKIFLIFGKIKYMNVMASNSSTWKYTHIGYI